MEYIAGIKYCLTQDEIFYTSIRSEAPIETRFISMSRLGVMTVKAGWVWDGCSGPTIDAPWNHRAGCGHDALYWLLRNKHLPLKDKSKIDTDFFSWLNQDINIISDRKKNPTKYTWKKYYSKIAQLYYWAVSKFADSAASPKNKRKKLTAP